MKDLISNLSRLSKEQKAKFIESLSPEELINIAYDWEGVFARPSQLEPAGDWTYWLILAGRGWG